ncbi:hypothetical protein VJI76_08320 [Parvimonas sp. M13]|nr:hypothetical protein [Parvimonas sp. M13]
MKYYIVLNSKRIEVDKMANWGTFDYDKRSASQAKIDGEAGALRLHLSAQGKDTFWRHNDKVQRGYNQSLVQVHCVRNSAWQAVRLSMKGVTTSKKLEILHAYWDKHYNTMHTSAGTDICEIQIGNYLGALRRGGQLDDQNRLRKEHG